MWYNHYSRLVSRTAGAWCLLCCLCVALPLRAQQVTEQWAAPYEGPGNTNSRVVVAVDNAGNSYVAGTVEGATPNSFKVVTIKYSPAGQQLWLREYNQGAAADIAVDNTGGVYVVGTNYTTGLRSFLTVRYDAATGAQSWVRLYHGLPGESSGGDYATALAVDKSGGVYVTGTSIRGRTTDYATVRYEAATGVETWGGGRTGGFRASAVDIAVDNAGSVYVTGTTNEIAGSSISIGSHPSTVCYDAATGAQRWSRGFGASRTFSSAAALAVDNTGGVYMTGILYEGALGGGYNTVRYEAATGVQSWVSRYDSPGGGDTDRPVGIAVDNAGGVYVTGSSHWTTASDCATVRYDAATGAQSWVSTYNSPDNGPDYGADLGVDAAGGVYVVCLSSKITSGAGSLVTLRYKAADGAVVWTTQKDGLFGNGRLAVDRNGNVLVAGVSNEVVASPRILTIKYSQGQCPVLADKAILGALTVPVGTSDSALALDSNSGATSFQWSIEGEQPVPFTGQGTAWVVPAWPATAGVYKVSVVYGGGAGCPQKTSVQYVAVYDLNAGFITGGGWVNSPQVAGYQYMSQATKASVELQARYAKNATAVTGSTRLTLDGVLVFTSAANTAARLVISGDKASYTGVGTLATYSGSRLTPDPRQFGFLVAATDGQAKRRTSPDKIRLKLWVLNADGSAGATVYDNQAGCGSAQLDENSEACTPLGGGSIVIHSGGKGEAPATTTAVAAVVRLSAYPTVVSDQATVAFVAEQEGQYELACYDVRGVLVRTLAAGTAHVGWLQQATFDAAGLPAGLYTIRLQAGTHSQHVRVLVQR
ncbi:SBBP repeat-containing protein [Hymenobacter chitinivorans]|uniref:Beta-propeller repeat-containing protein n=1 Tax=Hymenobacter chitinivorans DSM 11115 TaxID=1121954 RepID=A0A2M9BSJ4_9BACT|nr:SBBP repeat-containing protein [Hymenobacter chitinivorans]PJJ60929.1 beta-propeller repeat-containing protein [Hymenobacter chitinivorans DSM 11115]